MDSAGQDRKFIPRFSSFKPPPAAPPTDITPERRRHKAFDSDDDHHRSKRRRHSHRSLSTERHGLESHHRSQSRHKKPSRQLDGSREQRPPRRERDARVLENRNVYQADEPATTIDDDPTESTAQLSELYVIDRRGDRHNLTYGTIHRYSVPRYRRVGKGAVMGVDSHLKIDRDSANSDVLILSSHPVPSDSARLISSKSVSKSLISKQALFRLRPDASSSLAADATRDFIPFKAASHTKPAGAPADIDSDDEHHAYRSVLGKANEACQDPDTDIEAVCGSDTEGVSMRVDADAEARLRNAELSRAAESSPGDVDAWLRLIGHQDLLVDGPESSLADIKLSLYEKALKRVGTSPGRVALLVGLLEEGAKLWDTKKLSTKWRAVLTANPGFINLWVKYLDFRQTEFLDFTFERCMGTFIECLKLNESSDADIQQKYQVQCYLFLRLTLFIRESGFMELAVAVWQAVLEFSFFNSHPILLDEDQKGALSDFKEFWESEVARIGEPGAKGWKSGASSEVDPKTYTFQHKLRSHGISSWVGIERERMEHARVPARSLDEVDEEDDDPEKVILFGDLEDILSLSWNPHSPKMLAESFLYFCHLPHLTVPENSQTTRLWSGDNFLRNEFLDNPQYSLEHWVPPRADASDAPSSPLSPLSFKHHSFLHGTTTYFADPTSWFSSFASWKLFILHKSSLIDPDWVRLTLRSLVDALPQDDRLAEYALAVELACSSDTAKKYAKGLLKNRPASMSLYNAYALMQQRSGNHKDAERVWSTTLSMSTSLSERDRIDCALLWNSWIWECIDRGDSNRATMLLHAIPHNTIDLKTLSGDAAPEQHSATKVLTVQHYLLEAREKALSYRKPEVFAAYTDCLALLMRSDASGLEKSLDVYSTALSRTETLPSLEKSMKTFAAELLHQARARLIYHHVQRRGMHDKKQIRYLLEESASVFPLNTMLVSLLEWHKSQSYIYDRVQYIRDISTGTDFLARFTSNAFSMPVVPQKIPVWAHLFTIFTEMGRPVYGGSTAHSIRAAFERALGDRARGPDTGSARSNLTIWKLYILFELSRNNDLRRAKVVFYRAMRACPWSKELIMLAFHHLAAPAGAQTSDGGMDFYELCDLYNVLVEKGLRIHVDMGEQVEEHFRLKNPSADVGIGDEPGRTLAGPVHLPNDGESGDEH